MSILRTEKRITNLHASLLLRAKSVSPPAAVPVMTRHSSLSIGSDVLPVAEILSFVLERTLELRDLGCLCGILSLEAVAIGFQGIGALCEHL